MTKQSKCNKGIEYSTHNVAGKRYLTITYKGKRLYHSARPQKVAALIKEADITLYAECEYLAAFERAYTGTATEMDSVLASEFISKLSQME